MLDVRGQFINKYSMAVRKRRGGENMKKKLCLLMALICCVAVFAVAFAACNDNGEKSGGNGDASGVNGDASGGNGEASGGAGDVIFTEDASYDDIYNALANAESYQFASSAVYNGKDEGSYTITQAPDFYLWQDTGGYSHAAFIDGGYFYEVIIDGGEVIAEKQFVEYVSKEEDYFEPAEEFLVALNIIEKDGGLAFGEDTEPGWEGAYMRLEGTALYVVIPASGVDEEAGAYEGQTEYCVRGINAQYALPDEIRAMKADAVWASSVEYNGGHYEYDNDEECYYYLYGAVGEREDTINGLPVYDRQ